jgi:hypothetical protein
LNHSKADEEVPYVEDINYEELDLNGVVEEVDYMIVYGLQETNKESEA